MSPAAHHFRVVLESGIRRPLVWLVVVLVPVWAALGWFVLQVLTGTMAAFFATAGLCVGGVLATVALPTAGSRFGDRKLACPSLPLGPRSRALPEAGAMLVLLLLGLLPGSLLLGPVQWVLHMPSRMMPTPGAAWLLLPVFLFPGVMGASLQAGRGWLALTLGMVLPNLALALALTGGHRPDAPGLVLGALALAGALLAIGPLPSWRSPDLPLTSGASARPVGPHPLARDLVRGLLAAWLRALPVGVLSALLPVLTRSRPHTDNGDIVAVSVAGVGLFAALMPLGTTVAIAGTGSPWRLLPLSRTAVTTAVYLHNLISLAGLPLLVIGAAALLGFDVDRAWPVWVQLLPIALVGAAAASARVLRDWRWGLLGWLLTMGLAGVSFFVPGSRPVVIAGSVIGAVLLAWPVRWPGARAWI